MSWRVAASFWSLAPRMAAVWPPTLLSISSKMRQVVFSRIARAIFRAKRRRESSPPLAHWSRGRRGWLGVAQKQQLIWSAPVEVRGFGWISIAKRAWGRLRLWSSARMARARGWAFFVRWAVRVVAQAQE